MRTAWFWLALTLLLTLPVTASAQHQRGQSSRGLKGAVERLFEHREQLGMTEVQLARVQEIKDTADARKQPYWQQIMSVRRDLKARHKAQPDMSEAEKSALVKWSGRQIEELLDEIRDIDHAAMRDVGHVLTPEQREMLRSMVSRGRGDRDRSDSPGRREGSRD